MWLIDQLMWFVFSDAMSWDILLVTVQTAVVVVLVHVEEVVACLTYVATTAMKLDICHATVLLRHNCVSRSAESSWCRLVITDADMRWPSMQ